MSSIADKIERIEHLNTFTQVGKVTDCFGSSILCAGLDASVGDICEIFPKNGFVAVQAEVIGFKDEKAICLPLSSIKGVAPGSKVKLLSNGTTVSVSDNLIGRVLDAFGKPIDGKGSIGATDTMSINHGPINPLSRQMITEPMTTGVAVVDVCVPIGKGQRLGVFAGSGVGKSTLLAMLAKHSSADVNVISLIGERGREVEEFIEDTLGAEGMANSIIVAATADSLPLVRVNAAYTATAIAEYFCDKGKDVMLIMDSITRFATAFREIGLARGELPTSRGYTPSTFSVMPALVERAGNFKNKGSITGIYSVLVEGDDFNEPVSDSLRAVLDGHLMLTRELANLGQFPAVSVLSSISRLAGKVTKENHFRLLERIRQLMAIYDENKDRIAIGAYTSGQDSELDFAIRVLPKVNEFLVQRSSEVKNLDEILQSLARITGVRV